jgi:acetone carboxylase gamma subunit
MSSILQLSKKNMVIDSAQKVIRKNCGYTFLTFKKIKVAEIFFQKWKVDRLVLSLIRRVGESARAALSK